MLLSGSRHRCRLVKLLRAAPAGFLSLLLDAMNHLDERHQRGRQDLLQPDLERPHRLGNPLLAEALVERFHQPIQALLDRAGNQGGVCLTGS